MFKVGDRIRRVEGVWKCMQPGDEDVIIEIKERGANAGLVLENFGEGHAQKSFKLVEEEEKENSEENSEDMKVENKKEKASILASKLKNLKTTDVDNKIRNIKEEIGLCKRSIENGRNHMNKYYKELREHMRELDELKSRKNEKNDFTSEIMAILEHPYVKDMKVINSKEYEIFTDYIDIYDEDGNKFRGNEYKICFDFDYMDCRIFGLDEDLCRKSWWSEKDPHPHVSGDDGKACWGDAGSMLTANMNEYELYASFIVVLNFLQQVNTQDVAGRNICHWDCINEDGDDIENPYEDATIKCTICECDMDRDDAIYCEDCGEYTCSECYTYIDSEVRNVCANCVEENYFYCESCGEYYSNNEKIIRKDGEIYCEECADEELEYCENCDEYYEKDEVIHTKDGEVYCQECADEKLIYCSECNKYVKHDEGFECSECGDEYCYDCVNETDGMCDNCYEKMEEDKDEC